MPNSSCHTALPTPSKASWCFNIDGTKSTWDWSNGAPDVHTLQPVRRTISGALSKHTPVRAYSYTAGEHLHLESGLEHDLLRLLDRESDVDSLVSQPCQLQWGVGKRRTHVPDLLSVTPDGTVTVWDIKAPEAVASPTFKEVQALTEQSCSVVGWRYSVFTGVSAVTRHNLLWLHAYRARPAWAGRWESEILAQAARGTSLAELVGDDPARTALVWHLIWTARLRIDLSTRLVPASPVSVV